MAGAVSFKLQVMVRGGDSLPEMSARAKDFSPVFEAYIKKWADMNRQKFNKGKGMGMTGASIDPSVYWSALTDQYWRAKMKAGFPDNLMVRTGDLREALTNPDLFFSAVSANAAAFGHPLAQKNFDKIRGNWSRRQTIFLSLSDQNALRRLVQQYLNLGPDFQRIAFNKGMEQVNLRKEAAQMDIGFNEAMAGE